jgi:gamma-glutamylcyclotransferase (GGCT)/AIG2-like uncharacterized protein YtfP
MHYLAYGSNLQKERLENQEKNGKRIGTVADKGTLELNGYKLVFNKLSVRDGSGKANIEPEKGGSVIGVIYELSAEQIDLLDRIEGGYKRHELPVRFENQTVETYFAESDRIREGLFPTEEYMGFVVNGAIEHEFPEKYVEALTEIPTLG